MNVVEVSCNKAEIKIGWLPKRNMLSEWGMKLFLTWSSTNTLHKKVFKYKFVKDAMNKMNEWNKKTSFLFELVLFQFDID